MILAIDPGVTTGFCRDDKAYQINFSKFPNPHLALYEHLSEVLPDMIVYEAFHWRQGQNNAVFTGVEYIGIIQLWIQQRITQVRVINPSDGKGFWNNTKIKSLGLWVPGCPHGMDALRLFLTFKMKTNKDWFKAMVPKLMA